ncbi:hypothetical protein [Paenisporosarcina sp.]|uniref:hypothetical protein n=1 Tax=Paenisporosarcina sp. TaxID=1932001 RepID=UPI003C772848
MKNQLTLIVAAKWQQYMNERKYEELLKLTEANIEVVDNKGSNFGHNALLDYINRTGLTLLTVNSYVNEEKLILKHRRIWKSEDGENKKEALVYSYIKMNNGKVAYIQCFNDSEEAENASGISIPN